MSVALKDVLTQLRKWVGWQEVGWNDQRSAGDWGNRQGVGNGQPYCDSGACMSAYDAGYRWWPDHTYGEKGEAYTVTHVNVGKRHGEVMYDHASTGLPCDVLAGDLLFYDWDGSGEPDHVETAQEDCPSNGRTHNIGFNTGHPEGVWDLWRDRQYLLCRLRPSRNGGYTRGSTPVPDPITILKENKMFVLRLPDGKQYLVGGSHKPAYIGDGSIVDQLKKLPTPYGVVQAKDNDFFNELNA